MADNFLIKSFDTMKNVVLPETKIKKVEKIKLLRQLKKKTIVANKLKHKKDKHELKMRTYKYNAEYSKLLRDTIRNRRIAKVNGTFYKEAEAKVIFIIRLKGINKLAPKPKKILQLFRLRQIHNGVFIKINKATKNMLKVIEPFVTYGYPSLSTIRKLVYKRGYVKIGRLNKFSRTRITNNALIAKGLSKYNIHGVEDIVHELYTCGPNFKKVTNYLWPFKLNPPSGGFTAKRHGFNESRGGDWGNREDLINTLVSRMN